MTKGEKKVIYQSSNSYSTLNEFTSKTKHIWFACHGLGFLSRYFISYFKSLDKTENYVIAPQAPSKYYQGKDFKYVGASWLTKENTKVETKNVLNYLQAVYDAEQIHDENKLILFGFSQGVSVSTRWMVSQKIEPAILVIYAGRIPEELTAEDLAYLKNTKVKIIYGNQDPFINPKVLVSQKNFAEKLFGKDRLEIIEFQGKHEMNSKVISEIIEK